tara:strand:+ start:455 stop:796 length:342 start_codon:yes stop_codon:yes gene_type:complete
MKNLTTLFAVLTLTLMSCKKEAPIVNRVSYEATVFVDAEDINSTDQIMYKNDEVVLEPQYTRYNTGDVLRVEVKNTYDTKQDIGIEITANDIIYIGNAKHLEAGETLTLTYRF